MTGTEPVKLRDLGICLYWQMVQEPPPRLLGSAVSSDPQGALGDKQVSLQHLNPGCFEKPGPT